MSDLVERVARALFANDDKYRGLDWGPLSERVKDMFRSDARAAIAVVLEDQSAGQSASDARVAELEAENARLREALQAIKGDCIMYHKGYGPSDGDGYVMDASEIAAGALGEQP